MYDVCVGTPSHPGAQVLLTATDEDAADAVITTLKEHWDSFYQVEGLSPFKREVDRGPARVEEPQGIEALTIAELEDLGDEYGVNASDIEGSGAGGSILKRDWVRALRAAPAVA